MQLGSDKGFTATLSNTANTYVGGTTILAGRLIIAGDGSLGAAPTESLTQFNDSLTFDPEGLLDNAGPAVQADGRPATDRGLAVLDQQQRHLHQCHAALFLQSGER